MEPARKKPKLEIQVRRSNRLRGIAASNLELQPATLKPHEIFCANFGNVVLQNKLLVKNIQTSKLELTKRFQNLFKKEFNSEANSKDELLENLRDFFKSKYNVDTTVMSPGKPTPQTILPSTSQATFPLADANNTLPKYTLDIAKQLEYAEDLSIYIVRNIHHRPGIFNIMVNHGNLTASLKFQLSANLNLIWYNFTSFDFEKEPRRNTILFDMTDPKMIKPDTAKLLEYSKKHKSTNILILNVLSIPKANNYRILDLCDVPKSLLSNIESKEDFLLSNKKYHFDILYDIDIIFPRTEMEINFIFALCSQKHIAFNCTFQELSSKETDAFQDFIIKLYGHNLIEWSSIGNISFASNSIEKKYIQFLKGMENPDEFTYFANCVAATKAFVNHHLKLLHDM